jgi:hypothetical protein
MRFSLFLFLSGWFVASLLPLWAQNVDSIGGQPLPPQPYRSSLSRIDAVEVGGSLGNVLVMDRYQRAWTSGTALSNVIFTLRHRTLSDSTDLFARDYNHPTWGLSLQWANLTHATMQKKASSAWGLLHPVNYASQPGHLFALVGSFSRPFQRGSWGEWGYAIEEGLAFNTHPYNKKNNADNELTGSSLLFHFGASLYGELRLSSRISLRADLAFRHVSNGATYRPNKGANMWQPTLALQYELQPISFRKAAIKPNIFGQTGERNAVNSGIFSKLSPHWFVHLEGNLGIRTLLEEWLRTQYNTTPAAPDYRTDHFKQYMVYNLQADVMRRYARRWAVGGGVDVFTLPYVDELRNYAPRHGEGRKYAPLSLGIALKHESYYQRLSSYVHLGYYLFRETGELPSTDETPYYERVGLRYHLGSLSQGLKHRGLTLSIGIKAHKLKADFAEIGIGWDF